MNLTQIFDPEKNGNPVRMAWDRMSGLPMGKRVFSRLIGRAAPYTGSIGAEVVHLEKGRSEVRMPDTGRLRNHLRSVHAVALCNLAELTGNLALAYTLPDDARFIPTAINIEYLKKARGTITGIAHCDVVDSSEKKTLLVPVSLKNEAGEEVARATLTTLVGPKK